MVFHSKNAQVVQVHVLLYNCWYGMCKVTYNFKEIYLILNESGIYRNDPKFSDRYAWANSADPDQTAPDQGLHCLPFHLHRLDSLLYGRAT